MSKIGIFAPAAHGDLITVTSVLHYQHALWQDKEVVWFCNPPHSDALRHNTVVEVRPFPAEWVADVGAALGLKNGHNKLSQSRKHDFELTKDLEDGFFPVPWMFTAEQRHGVTYPNISKRLFGVGDQPWHPVLCFSKEEREEVRDFCSELPHEKTIMLETEAVSGHSAWNDGLTYKTMQVCREKLGACNFIFASRTDNSRFFDAAGVVSCAHLTVRQTSLVNDYSDLFVGVSSGISVATSRWGAKPTPKIQYCGSRICSTVDLAIGHISLIEGLKYVEEPPPYRLDKLERAFEVGLRKLL